MMTAQEMISALDNVPLTYWQLHDLIYKVPNAYSLDAGIDQVNSMVGSVSYFLHTKNNRYHITAKAASDSSGKDSYLGCCVRSRIAEKNESYLRGSDLQDGPLTLGTYFRMLQDIVAYELDLS